MNSRLLGGLTPRGFLRRHWQKRPLFVRAALAQIGNLPDRRALAAYLRTLIGSNESLHVD